MDRARRTIVPTAVAALLAIVPACATVLDFQDPIDPPATSANELASDGAAADTSTAPTADASTGSTTDGSACGCASIPEGWRGPLRFEETTGSPASCAGDFPQLDYEGNIGLEATPASCSCTCGSPAGIACSPTARLFGDGACGSTCADATTPLGSCARLTPSTGSCSSFNGMRVTVAPTGGSCAPSSAGERIAPPTWTEKVRLCAAVAPTRCQASCAANVCIARAGTNECPSAFPVAHVAYGGALDSRACSTCSCGAPGGAQCSGTVSSYSNSSCATPTASASADGACVAVSSSGRVTFAAGSATGGSCVAAGGAASGTVAATDPTTICCLH